MKKAFYPTQLGLFLSGWCLWLGLTLLQPEVFAESTNGNMTSEKALILAEKFGVDVGEVDEEIQKILGLTKPEGVVVFAVIGGSPAELSGIKVKAIIKEIDKHEIKTLMDLGNALEQSLPTKNFTVATYEPADPDNQGISGGLNFHFVRILQD
jgi:membrane-associated protease RseP (regulator of RpoE activity)